MTVCVTCEEPYRDPWAPSADGNGETCSPLCVFRDALRFHHGPEDAAQRVAALREVVEQEVSPADMPTLRFTLAGPEDCDPAPYVVVGCAFDSSGGFVQIEDMDGEGALLAWSEVLDVREEPGG